MNAKLQIIHKRKAEISVPILNFHLFRLSYAYHAKWIITQFGLFGHVFEIAIGILNRLRKNFTDIEKMWMTN
jgi:hypothetical protein